jgi:WD40 repeat protein
MRPVQEEAVSAKSLVLALLLTILSAISMQAQEAPALEIITAQRVGDLRSVNTIDFASLPDDAGPIDSGTFILSPNGAFMAVVRRDGGLLIYDVAGDVINTYTVAADDGTPTTVIDSVFGADSQTTAALHTDGQTYEIVIFSVGSDEPLQRIPFPEPLDFPVRVWLDQALENVWLEVAPGDPAESYYVMRLPIDGGNDIYTLPSGPQNDPDSLVRIGRIPAPLAVTATLDGVVKLWNLEIGEVIAQADVGITPIFGRVNESSAGQMAWIDPESQRLELLNFETGENRTIAALGGEYAQAILLTLNSDVILGVAIDDAPIVVAWNVATGERIDLGQYRACSRVPDSVHLSLDGTTLAIGCDLGLDVWRVSPD